MKSKEFGIWILLFYDRGPCHKETIQLNYRENQWTDFYIIETSAMKELYCDYY